MTAAQAPTPPAAPEGSKWMRLLLLGDPKTGKTTAAITTAPAGGIAVLNSDLGDTTVYARRSGRPFDEFVCDSAQRFEYCYKRVMAGVAEGRYNTVIWDTITEYARSIEAAELEAAGGNVQGAYGELARRVMSAVTRLMRKNDDGSPKLAAHVVFVAHGRLDDKRQLELDMSGSARRRVAGAFNDIWLMQVQAKQPWKAVMTRKPAGICNSRTVPDDCWELPADLAALWARMQGGGQ